MISPTLENEIRRLVASGLSQRQVARDLNVARDTVSRVLKRRPRPEESCDPPVNLFDGPIGRCPTCGSKVHLPCYACYVEAYREARWKQNESTRHGSTPSANSNN